MQDFYNFVTNIIIKDIDISNTSNPIIINDVRYENKYTCISSYPIRKCRIGQSSIGYIDIKIPYDCYQKISPIIKIVENGKPIHLTDIKPHFRRFVRYDYECELL
jgi:hypothetical protein